MHYTTALHVCTAAKTSKKKPTAAESDDDVSEVQAVEVGESTAATASGGAAGGATGVLSSHSSDDINIADTVSLLYPPLALRTPRQKRTQVNTLNNSKHTCVYIAYTQGHDRV
jgi:hypothetical protein